MKLSKKSIRIVCMLLTLVFAFSMASAAMAADNNPTGKTVDSITKGDSMDTNEGTVKKNYGTVGNNEGTVNTNYGTVTVNEESGIIRSNYNGGIIDENKGTVADNVGASIIDNNEGTVTYNTATVNNNIGIVKTNHGTVKDNSSGTIESNSGTVEENSGTVAYNSRTVEENSGIVEYNGCSTNSDGDFIGGYVTNAEGGVVKENYGVVFEGKLEDDGTITHGTDTLVGMSYMHIIDEDEWIVTSFSEQWNATKNGTYKIATYNDVKADIGPAPEGQRLAYWTDWYDHTYKPGASYSEIAALYLIAVWEDIPVSKLRALKSEAAGGNSFVINGGAPNKFLRVKVDRQFLTAGTDYTISYDASTGFTVTFTDAFLGTLESGTHNAEVDFSDSYSLFTFEK